MFGFLGSQELGKPKTKKRVGKLKTTPMANKHAAELKAFGNKLNSLKKTIGKVNKHKAIDSILEMIRVNKGWTTPAEFAFANSIVNSLQSQFNQIEATLAEFESSCRRVGK